MEAPDETESRRVVCQPFTVGGVVEYSRRSIWRLAATAFFVLVFGALSFGWLVRSRWAPVIDAAVKLAPEQGRIHAGRLKWLPAGENRLAGNGYLAVIVDPQDGKARGQSADVQLELGGSEFRLCSLFGCLPLRYDPSWDFALDKAYLTPLWQAWRPALQAGAAAAAAAWIFAGWIALALFYGSVLWIGVKVLGRELGFFGALKLAAASLMAPAVWMGFCILAYAFGTLSFGGVLAGSAVHLVIPWFYLAIAPFNLKKAAVDDKDKSVFAPPESKPNPSPKSMAAKSLKKKNPFS